MHVVADSTGVQYARVGSGDCGVIVRALHSGRERTVPASDLSDVETLSLSAIGERVPATVRSELPEARTDRARGFLAVLYQAGPLPVAWFFEATTLCESDLHGLVGDLRAAGLVAPARIDGIRGYEVTPAVTDAFELG